MDLRSFNKILTMESIILSFNAKVSPCFSLILFLSRHFMAYLNDATKKECYGSMIMLGDLKKLCLHCKL